MFILMRNVPACSAFRMCWDLNPWLIGHSRNIQWCHVARRFDQRSTSLVASQLGLLWFEFS